MENTMRRVSISSDRQITIPQIFFAAIGFGSEAECIMHGNELIVRPVRNDSGSAFSKEILADLLAQGYSGQELLEEFKKQQRKVRPAVEALLSESKDIARGKKPYATFDDIFGAEE